MTNVTPPRPEGETRVTLPAARAAASPATKGSGEEGDEGGSAAAELAPVSRKFLAQATLITAVLSVAGALLGLVRDQSLARLFGAGSDTDAFLVAWTVPEFAATLLIEDGLAFVLIPAFSMALARRAQGAPGDPVRALVASTLPRLALACAGVGALLIASAPYLVEALAPGLPDPSLAVDCTRLTATCVFSFGLAGYCSAALRAHRRFLAPAAIYVAYNVGIITAMFVLGGHWGVRSAAVGVAVGGALMVVTQLPSLLRQLRRRRSAVPEEIVVEETSGAPMAFALVAPVLLFALTRQSQVLIERFLASTLPAGAISHLNYAQKVAQIPMTLSLMLCTVTFPVVAQAIAEGDTERARDRVERDLALAAWVVLLGAAAVVACAPQIIELLFQRGAFTARDTEATATVMRVYAVGLLGHTLVGALIRSYFSSNRPTWYPLASMTAGIVATTWIGVWAVGPWGVSGIAAANAAGITLSAVLLLYGAREPKGCAGVEGASARRPEGLSTVVPSTPAVASRRRALLRRVPRSVPIRTRRVLAELSKPVRAAVCATAAGAFVTSRIDGPVAGLAAGTATVTVVFFLLGRLMRAQAVQSFVLALRSVRSLTRRLPHARKRTRTHARPRPRRRDRVR